MTGNRSCKKHKFRISIMFMQHKKFVKKEPPIQQHFKKPWFLALKLVFRPVALIVCSVLHKWHLLFYLSAHSDFGFFSCVGYLHPKYYIKGVKTPFFYFGQVHDVPFSPITYVNGYGVYRYQDFLLNLYAICISGT